jgi:hypothetical protein
MPWIAVVLCPSDTQIVQNSDTGQHVWNSDSEVLLKCSRMCWNLHINFFADNGSRLGPARLFVYVM